MVSTFQLLSKSLFIKAESESECGFHTRERSVTIATIDKSQLTGTFCQKIDVLVRSVASRCVLIRSVPIRYDRVAIGQNLVTRYLSRIDTISCVPIELLRLSPRF